MKFFNKYPKVNYKFGANMSTNEFTDISRYADIIDQVKDDATTYQYYVVQDGERPDIVSYKLYGSEIYGWTFWILNDHIRDTGWPLSYADFREFLTETLPGECLVVNDTDTHSVSGITCHALTEQFPIGTSVYGSTSGAQGTVYLRNLNLGQLFVSKSSSTDFIAGETIANTLVGTPTSVATIASRSNAYQAAHHYLDSNSEYIDIDPTTGIVPSEYTEVTHEEYLQALNDSHSKIKVLKPGLVNRFATIYKDVINR